MHELSVNHDQMNVSSHSGSLLVELRVLPPPPSLPYSGNVKLTARLSALAVRKRGEMLDHTTIARLKRLLQSLDDSSRLHTYNSQVT